MRWAYFRYTVAVETPQTASIPLAASQFASFRPFFPLAPVLQVRRTRVAASQSGPVAVGVHDLPGNAT